MMKDNIVVATLFVLFVAAFFSTIGYGVQQQRACDAACAPARSMTPVVGRESICLCDEGQGKWRRQELAR